MKRMSVLAAIALVAAAPLSAQSLNGTWFTEFERQIRNQDGEVTAGEKTKAKITLQQKGDKGTIVSEFEARRNINGEEETVKLVTTYDFTISADKLEGTTKTRTPDFEIPPRPFSAWREKP